MAAFIKNYAARITRKLKKPDERGNEWISDLIVNDIAFIEGDRYNCKIDDLVEKVKNLVLPKDIMIEMVHNWSGTLPEGSPLSVTTALQKDGYTSPGLSSCTGWFKYDSEEKACSQKLIIQCEDDISYLKYRLWAETALSSVKWEQSDTMRKAIEMGQPYSMAKPMIREWWM